ncbi:MAG: AAA family ATPase [bacterium]
MNYYEVFGLSKEPFSTSPDPAFLYLSGEHRAALCRLQINISLRRGLSVIMGDVGTGKTTLSRKLAQTLHDDENILFHMLLNPYFRTQKQFLYQLAKIFHLPIVSNDKATGIDLIEAVERYLFRKGVTENKTIVLLIDEAQIVPDHVFEVLRILLNYETNEFKILQLVLVGQLELLARLRQKKNFWDRIALKYVLNPLGKDDLVKAIEFRLTQAGCNDINKLFTAEAMEMIFSYTQGYPRRFTLICHNALAGLVMYEKQTVDAEIIRHVIDQDMKASSAGV